MLNYFKKKITSITEKTGWLRNGKTFYTATITLTNQILYTWE